MKKIISVCVLLVMAMPSIAEETLLESIKSPIPVAMKLQGCEEYSGDHLLIAGTNATAIITIKDYYPEWTEWLEGGRNAGYARYGGRFRHKIKSIIVVAYPSAELVDETSEKWWDGTEYWKSMFRNNSYTSPACQMSEYVCSGENLAVLNLEDHHCQATAEFTLNKGDGYHGEFYWTAIVEYEHEDEQGIYPYGDYEGPISSLMESLYILDWACGCSEKVADAADIDGTEGSHLLLRDETGRVFFDKDSTDDGKNPNWFVYWNKDGAVPQLAEASYSKVPVFDSLLASGGEVSISNGVDLLYSDTRGHLDSKTGKVVLHMAAGDSHLYAYRPDPSKYVYERNMRIVPENIKRFWDDPIYGIYTVENVLAHECQHKKVHDEYKAEIGSTWYSRLFGSMLADDGLWRSIAREVQEEFDTDLGFEEIGIGIFGERYTKLKMGRYEYKDAGTRTIGSHALCDQLTDVMETTTYAAYGLCITNLDTHKLGQHKHPQYKYYGDDEYLAMCAGYEANQKGHSRVCEEKDWGFPGYQSWLPPPFQQCRASSESSVKLASASLPLSATDTENEQADDNTGEMECATLESQFVPAAVGQKYKEVAYNFAFDVTGTNRIEIIGLLSDMNSNVVARAMVRQAFSPTQNTCTLVFNGREIYENGKNGPYMLLGLVFREFDDTDAYFLSAVSGFNLPNLDCTYTDFINGDASILREGMSENVSSNGLFVGVNIESQVNNAFQLSADILDADGSKIVTVTTNINCAVGTNQFVLSLASSKIKSSRKNGPYTISNVKLKNDTIDVDQAAVLYTTTMSDFASYFGFTEDPTKTVVVDGRTWRYQVVDGKAIIKYELEYYGYKFNYCAVTPVPSGTLSIPSLLRNWPVVSIGEEAFTDCDTVTEIAIPATVTNISSDAFKDCSSLTNLIFNGNAPVVADDVFADVAEGCFITANAGSIGWDDDGDGLWNGLPIVYVSNEDPIPQIEDSATADDVAAALSGSKDDKLTANITNAVNYNAYRAWAEIVKKSDGSAVAGAQAVKDSPNAWLSFAIGSQKLIDATPTNGQMKIDQFNPTSTAGSFDFTVSIDDVSVGSDATAENLKKVFGLEGGSTLKDMSSTNVNITFGTPTNGKVKFTAGPKDTKQSPFFMKVKMTP